MALENRNLPAILYTSLIFGTISCPYCYMAAGALSYFRSKAIWIMIPWLAASTAVLLTILISRSQVEERLAGRLGRSYRPVLIAAAILAMSGSLFIESKIANYTLLLPVEYWYYLILFSAAATAIALIVVVFTRPSRLERFIADQLSRHAAYRTVGYLALTVGLVFVFAKLYEYSLYKRPIASGKERSAVRTASRQLVPSKPLRHRYDT